MSTYEQLADTVEKIETQAIVAEIRLDYAMYARWRIDDEDNPTTVHFDYDDRQIINGVDASVTLDWATGEVTSRSGDYYDIPHYLDPQEKFQGWKSKWQGRVAELFDKFLEMPDPGDFASQARELDTTGEYLNGGGFKIGDTEFEGTNLDYYLWQVGNERSKLNDWNGDAAKAFRDTYLATWNGNLSNQFAALCLLKLSILREEALWEKCREQIAHAADDAVEAMKGADGGEGSGLALAIFTAVAGVTSIFVPVAGQVALGVITGALTIADAAAEEPDQVQLQFSADTPDGVYDKIVEGLDQFDSEVWDAEYAVYRPIRDLQDKLAERTPFLGRGADGLLGSTDPGDVGLEGDTFEVGEIDNLRTVAQICINAGGDARTAGIACSLTWLSSIRTRRARLGFTSDGCAEQYRNCTTMLRDIILDNGVIITDCGEQLDAAANTYSDTDQDSARRMTDHTSDLEELREDDDFMPHPPSLPPALDRTPGPMP